MGNRRNKSERRKKRKSAGTKGRRISEAKARIRAHRTLLGMSAFGL